MTIDQTLQLAKERHIAGDHRAASELYHQVLSTVPNNATAIFAIGVLEMQSARFDQALPWVTRAAALSPTEPRYSQGLAQTLSALNRYNEAIPIYCKLLILGTVSADIHFSLGVALHMTGKPAAAIPEYRKALELQPKFPGALTNLGAALQAVGQIEEAIEPLRAAIRLEPNVLIHQINLGALLCQQRNFTQAEVLLRRVLAMDPNSPEAAYNLANVLKGLGRPPDAIEMYRRAIALNPDYADAHNNLATVHKEQGDFKSAADSLEAAMRAGPDLVAAYNNSGCLLRTLGRMDEAEAVLRKALKLGLNSATVYTNLGNALKDSGDLDGAIDSYRKAIDLNPSDPESHSNLAYALSFQATDGKIILEECRRWNARHAEPLRPAHQVFENQPTTDRRLRIGYISADFRDHCQSLFTIPLLSNHNHEAFEIVCYSSVERPDPYTSRIASYADTWREVRLLDDAQLAQLIRADGIDILVDLGMHMSASRPLVFARAPAPVQVAWLAYPGTTGITAIQYRLTDPRLDSPGFDEQYAEQSIRLPNTFWCYDPLAEVEINPLPALTRGFVTLGCLNNPCKLTDRTLSIWTGVMHQLPSARLLLMAPPGNSRHRLFDRLGKNGITPDRVSFESFRPRSDYLRSYHGIDLGLDTFPYNGHTTSLDSFWMGVPVVTRIGETAVGRGGLSQLFNLDLCELAADSDEQFIRIAVELASNLPRLAELRRNLRSRMENSPLMNGKQFTGHLESAYRSMWATYCQSPKFHA